MTIKISVEQVRPKPNPAKRNRRAKFEVQSVFSDG